MLLLVFSCVCVVGQDEEALVQEWGIGAMAANPDERIPETDETTRLAVVDLDWDKIRAVDILAVLRSFLVKGQSIKAVSVYPSDFGLQKMKEEAAVGPQVRSGATWFPAAFHAAACDFATFHITAGNVAALT